MPEWNEVYAGGSAEAEHRAFQKLAQDIMLAQLKTKKAAKASAITNREAPATSDCPLKAVSASSGGAPNPISQGRYAPTSWSSES